ncbi:uncharacterized protein [Macrobrachium rosenbergii]|uniref:uncharacterized protein n=1 Tax=Macrobrachium rosenbergii TaxID=79674 RepID=UPI0034D6A4DB
MKTLVLVAVIASFCIANGVADPEAEADPGFNRGFYNRGFGSHLGGFSSFGHRRWRRSADPEPEATAVADAEPEPEASPSFGQYGFGHRPFGSSFGFHRRWRRSADPEADAEPEPEAPSLDTIFGTQVLGHLRTMEA